MADDVSEAIENALNIIVNTAERSGNIKRIEANYIWNHKYSKKFICKVEG